MLARHFNYSARVKSIEKRPIDVYPIHFICQFHQFCGINARVFHLVALQAMQGILADLIA